MSPFTVVLLRPQRISELDDSRLDVYVALVSGKDAFDAQKAARREVLKADKKDCKELLVGQSPLKASEYVMLLTFNGHQNPVWFGWQTGVQTA